MDFAAAPIRRMTGAACKRQDSAVLPRIIFDGNSLSALSDSGGATNRYMYQTGRKLLPDLYECKYVASGGRTTANMIADAATRVDAFYDAARPSNIVVAWEITNDLFFGASAATAYNNIVTYCQGRQAEGFQVVVLSVLPRSGLGVPDTFEASRQTINTNLRANWESFADALADIGADETIGVAGADLDTTFYIDGVHMTDAGYGLVAEIVKDAIQTL